MKKWTEANQWWISLAGVLLGLSFACFPQEYAAVGDYLKGLISSHWLPGILGIIILLLFVILFVLLKMMQQKNDPSA